MNKGEGNERRMYNDKINKLRKKGKELKRINGLNK